jgi:hypothetical protein
MMTIAPRCEVAAVWRAEILMVGQSAPLLHPLEAAPACASPGLLRAAHRERNPRWTAVPMIPLLNVLDVKKNVRVTPITSYHQRCVVLPFRTLVDAPCPSCCNRA